VNQDGQYQIRAAGREFLLKDDGTLLGSIRSKAQTSDVDANTVEYQALARVLLVSGKVLFVPPRLSAKAAYQCPPSSLAFDAVINRAQWGITKMTHAVMDILGIKHAAADRTLVGECSVDTSAVAITVELGPSEQTVTREPSPYTMRFRLYSDGILEIKETRDWFFHPCRAGDPVKGFVWHETREWIIPL
jgi:hypothetical protein